jgi:integrase
MYYSALRPEEAVNLRRANLDLPETGWGWLTLEGAAPEVDRHWTNAGTHRREERELKHRAVRESRRVPCPPALTAILHEHLKEFGTDTRDGSSSANEASPWPASPTTGCGTGSASRCSPRIAVLTEKQYESPLVRRPYDLGHACVSTWLNGGVAPTQVAEWAGHSVEVLLKIYAKCLDGQEDIALRRIEEALGESRAPLPGPAHTAASGS